jgi:hypothetical protein
MDSVLDYNFFSRFSPLVAVVVWSILLAILNSTTGIFCKEAHSSCNTCMGPVCFGSSDKFMCNVAQWVMCIGCVFLTGLLIQSLYGNNPIDVSSLF